MTSWLDEILHGVRKRDDRGVELRNMQITELSGVDDPAHGIPDWVLLKATSGKTKLTDLSDDQLDAAISDYKRAASENPGNESLASHLAALRAERARRTSLSKNATHGWGRALTSGKIRAVVFR